MPPESHPNYTITSLVWILFGLWCFSLVILSMAVFDMDIAEYNATCYLIAENYNYDFSGTCMQDIFFGVFLIEMFAISIITTVISAICGIVSMKNSRNPTLAKTASVAFLIMFAEILECIVVLKIVYPKTTGAPTKTWSVYVPISSLFTVTGILVGLSGWILNGFYYFNLRNQISSSPLARRSVVSPDSSSCSEISIQSSPFYSSSSLQGSVSEFLSGDEDSVKSYSEGYIPYYRTDSILCL